MARQDATLNQLPQYRVALEGFHVHSVHVRSKDPKPLLLIITHGWPGSFVEMVKLIPLLTDPAAHGGRVEDAFDVIVPSLPGYGFSDRPAERGMNPFKVAALWARLMAELGYERFAAQGGDWAQQAGISRLVGQPAHGCESHIRGSRRQPAIFVNPVAGDNCLVEGQARLCQFSFFGFAPHGWPPPERLARRMRQLGRPVDGIGANRDLFKFGP